MMRVDINLTFPSLHCDDLHIDLMDVAGDVQLNAEDKMIKKRLQLDGSYLSVDAIEAETNAHHQEDAIKYAKKLEKLGPNYCGECYGAEENAAACCNSYDDLLNAYKKKGWNIDQVRLLSEQCIRDGQTQPKKMSIGEGCEIAGHMIFNRVAGNFHIAMVSFPKMLHKLFSNYSEVSLTFPFTRMLKFNRAKVLSGMGVTFTLSCQMIHQILILVI